MKPNATVVPDEAQRLQKVLAASGLGSRRKCEELILAGRVEVDRKIVTRLGTKVDPLLQKIRVDGEALSLPELVYYLVHKPTGVLSTNRDPSGRMRVIDLILDDRRLFTVGRLDFSSEGLILVTNDGQMANQLTHPRYGIEKTYHVQVAGLVKPETLAKLRRGVRLADGVAQPVHLRVKSRYKKSSILEMVLDEGRNREIRRILSRVGHKVQRLRRVAFGPLRLGQLPYGECRLLRRDEIRALDRAIKTGIVHAKKNIAQKKTAQKNTTARKSSAGNRTAKKSTRGMRTSKVLLTTAGKGRRR